jgi:general secretion pathway protein L
MKLKERLAASLRQAGSRRIEVRLPRGWPDAESSVRWYAPSGSAERGGYAASLAELPDFVRGAPVHLWTPAAETLLTHAAIPTRSRARILQALPYALEDQLLDEPERLHFAYVRETDGSLAVAVTRRDRLSSWLETLAGAGISVASLCPAHLALPLQSNAWSIAFVDQEMWVRIGAFAGFTTLASAEPPPLLIAALKEAEAERRAPQNLIVFRPPGMLDLDSWSAALGLPVVADGTDFWETTSVPALNLLQAEFSGTGHLRQMARPLRPAAILLAILVLGGFTVDIIEWIKLRRLHNQYQADMHEIYRTAFGTTAYSPYDQMVKGIEQLQARGGGPNDMLPLLSNLAPTLKAQQSVRLNGFKYSERSLTLDLTLPDFKALEAMKGALQGANLDVEVLNANKRADEVQTSLSIKPSNRAKPG